MPLSWRGVFGFQGGPSGPRVAPATLRLSRYLIGMCYFSGLCFMVLLHLLPTISAERVLATRGTVQADGRRRGDGHAELVEVSAEAAELTRRHAVSCFGSSFRKKVTRTATIIIASVLAGGLWLSGRSFGAAGLPRWLSITFPRDAVPNRFVSPWA